jgi:hypothetical protein
MDFPSKFPDIRDFTPETGSQVTASATTQSSVFAFCRDCRERPAIGGVFHSPLKLIPVSIRRNAAISTLGLRSQNSRSWRGSDCSPKRVRPLRARDWSLAVDVHNSAVTATRLEKPRIRALLSESAEDRSSADRCRTSRVKTVSGLHLRGFRLRPASLRA